MSTFRVVMVTIPKDKAEEMAQKVIEKFKNLPGKSKAEYIGTLAHFLSVLKLRDIVSMEKYDIAKKDWIRC